MTIQLKPYLESDPIMQKFFAYYIGSELSSSTDHLTLHKHVEEFASQNRDSLEELILKHYREYTTGDFEFDAAFSEESQYNFVIGFENFLIALYRAIKGMPMQMEFKDLEKQANPPLEVYNFLGHNKLDIKHNRIKYSSLFK